MEEQNDELVAKTWGSPFYREIREAPLPEGFKLPSIEAYEGKAYPQRSFGSFQWSNGATHGVRQYKM